MEEWQVLWELFVTFLMVGAVSFGGGYAMIPVIEREVTAHGWMTLQEFTDVIAVASMSPGPFATNAAIVIGYKVAGMPGSIIGSLAVTLPSLLIVVAAASFFYQINRSEFVKRGFYGLRPIVAGLIVFAAITFAIGNGVVPTTVDGLGRDSVILLGLFLVSLTALIRFKVHPVLVILASGLAGAILF